MSLFPVGITVVPFCDVLRHEYRGHNRAEYKQVIVNVKWHPGKENLTDYASKHQDTKNNKTVRPLYLHKMNSPRDILRAMTPSVLRGCVVTKLGGRPQPLCGLDPSLVPDPRTWIIVP